MSYSKIQFIGYAIDIAVKDGEANKKKYFGLSKPQNDIDARAKLMLRALETARSKITPSSDILKVFVAPEFFFRGKKGSYKLDDAQYAVNALQAIAADGQWKDWLLACGSIVGEWPEKSNPENLTLNYALIQEGGVEAAGPANVYDIAKNLSSAIDFIAAQKNPGSILLGQVEQLHSDADKPAGSATKVSYDGAGIFESNGITWACEICLDQRDGRLLQPPMLPGEHPVQIQLALSGDVVNTDGAAITETGGYILNINGQMKPFAKLIQTNRPTSEIDPVATIAVDNSDIELGTKKSPKPVAISELFGDGPGNLVLFDPVDTPSKSTVPGTSVLLVWNTHQDSELNFDLIYDADGKFSTAMCSLTIPEFSNNNNRCFLPVNVTAVDPDGDEISIKITLDAGVSGFDRSCHCIIKSERYNFSGIAFLFNENLDDQQPMVSW